MLMWWSCAYVCHYMFWTKMPFEMPQMKVMLIPLVQNLSEEIQWSLFKLAYNHQIKLFDFIWKWKFGRIFFKPSLRSSDIPVISQSFTYFPLNFQFYLFTWIKFHAFWSWMAEKLSFWTVTANLTTLWTVFTFFISSFESNNSFEASSWLFFMQNMQK